MSTVTRIVIDEQEYDCSILQQWVSETTRKTKTGRVFTIQIQFRDSFIALLEMNRDKLSQLKLRKVNYGYFASRDKDEYAIKAMRMKTKLISDSFGMVTEFQQYGCCDLRLWNRTIDYTLCYTDDEEEEDEKHDDDDDN